MAAVSDAYCRHYDYEFQRANYNYLFKYFTIPSHVTSEKPKNLRPGVHNIILLWVCLSLRAAGTCHVGPAPRDTHRECVELLLLVPTPPQPSSLTGTEL